MTHKELVEISYKWLLKNGGVGVAFKELKSLDREIPDVIGFDSWQSVLIECKVSRNDFLSDKNKIHRDKGMGNWRFFSCPKDMIKVNELPEKWGLIYVDENGKAKVEYDCRKRKETIAVRYPTSDGKEFETVIRRADENRFEADTEAERRIMYTAIRRLFLRGYMKFIYDDKYDKSATTDEIIQLNQTNNS